MKTLAPLLLLGLVACGTTESGTDHDSHDTSGAGTHEHTTTTGGSTTHEHASEHGSTDHEHPTSTTDTTTGGGSPVADYCECMLVHCHDQYHATWGEEHPMSELNCTADAEKLPTVGMPTMTGNSLECRLSHCQLAPDDASLCEAAIGGPPCV